jgi:hypothetical protein
MVSGNPSITGGSFTVRVDDAAGQAAGAKTSIPISPRFTAAQACGPNNVCVVEQGCTVVCGLYASLSGGVGPYNYSLQPSSPPIPTGTTFGGPSLGGTFKTVGRFPFAVDIADAFNVTVSVSPLFDVFSGISLLQGTACCNGGPGSASLPFSGGDGKVSNVTFQNVPLDVNGKPLTPTWSANGSTLLITVPAGYSTQPVPTPLLVTLFDGSRCGPGYNCSSTAPVNFILG